MTRFRRLVLELGHGAADPETIRETAAFAQLIDAELHALFVEDETLLHASALPFAREISPLSYQWRKFEPDRLEAELKAAVDQARRHLEAAAHATGVRRSFEVRRGDLALHVTDICVASDIVVVSAPRWMGTGFTRGFQRLRATACQSVASVLFLPPNIGRKHGSIVAVAANAADNNFDVARRIALQAREQLLVLAPVGSVLAGEASVRILPGTGAQDVVAALGDSHERLIVLTRADDTEGVGSVLAAARGVPVLMMEPV
jgi:hypothetical protein